MAEALPGADPEHIAACLRFRNSPGLERSKLQKGPRLGAKRTRLQDGTVVDTALAVACSAAVLLCSPKQFHHALHKTLRSDLSALTRAVVIAVEDAFVPGSVPVLHRLMLEALLCDASPSYFPGRASVLAFGLLAEMVATDAAVNFRGSAGWEHQPPTSEELPVTPGDATRLEDCRRLSKIKSPPGT